jgi:hypothetical protein
MQEVQAPIRARHYIGWVFLGLTLIPLITVSLWMHIKENREIQAEQDASRWQANWAQLKLGMSKEQVLALVGAPNSTTVMEGKITSIQTDPSNPQMAQDVQQALDRASNYAIWSYYGSIVIHTTPGEDTKTAEGEGETQLKELVNFDASGKLHGHAIKFNGAGEIVEISPP